MAVRRVVSATIPTGARDQRCVRDARWTDRRHRRRRARRDRPLLRPDDRGEFRDERVEPATSEGCSEDRWREWPAIGTESRAYSIYGHSRRADSPARATSLRPPRARG